MFRGVCFQFVVVQAEDGIRDVAVTGVQTCALPIYVSVDRNEDFFDDLANFFTGRYRNCLLEVALELLDPLAQLARVVSLRDRKSVVKGKSVDLGGRRIIEKNTVRSEERRVGKECRS